MTDGAGPRQEQAAGIKEMARRPEASRALRAPLCAIAGHGNPKRRLQVWIARPAAATTRGRRSGGVRQSETGRCMHVLNVTLTVMRAHDRIAQPAVPFGRAAVSPH